MNQRHPSERKGRACTDQVRGARIVVPWVVAIVATSVALVLHLTVRFETIRLGYEVGELRAEYEGLVEKKRLLMLERATLRHVPRIRKIATHVFAMEPPDPARVIRVVAPRLATPSLPSSQHANTPTHGSSLSRQPDRRWAMQSGTREQQR